MLCISGSLWTVFAASRSSLRRKSSKWAWMEILEVASFQTKPAAAQMGEMFNVVYLNANDSSSRLGAYKVHSNLIIAFNMACSKLPASTGFPSHWCPLKKWAFTSLSGSLLKFWHGSESMTEGWETGKKREVFSPGRILLLVRVLFQEGGYPD